MRRVLPLIVAALLLLWSVTATVLLVLGRGGLSDPGSIADWVTAVVTLLALAAAIWAAVAAQGQLKLMSTEAAAANIENIERQARLVSVLHERALLPDRTFGHFVTISNRSSEPISNVTVLFFGPTNRNGFYVGTVGPDTTGIVVGMAGEVVSQVLEEMVGGHEERRFMVDMIDFEFPILFTDARNRRWHRRCDNTLVQRSADYTVTDAQDDLEGSKFRV